MTKIEKPTVCVSVEQIINFDWLNQRVVLLVTPGFGDSKKRVFQQTDIHGQK